MERRGQMGEAEEGGGGAALHHRLSDWRLRSGEEEEIVSLAEKQQAGVPKPSWSIEEH